MNEVVFAAGDLASFCDQVGDDRPLHVVVVGTKPDLIKQAPILHELLKRGEKAILVHTGQHYDENLSGGIEKEFGLQVDVNLKVAGGTLTDLLGKLISRWGSLCVALKEHNPNLQVIPYVHGDTTTAFGTTTASFAHGFPTVHVEAGIRTYMIGNSALQKSATADFTDWFEISSDLSNYTLGSHEPFPEQWNTRATEAGTGLFMTPVSLATDNLQNEGFPNDRIFEVGNTVVDAMDFTNDIESDIFDRYPDLADGFVRVCIHRRENTESDERFLALFEMVEQLAGGELSVPILWILLPGTKKAIERLELSGRLDALKNNEQVLISDVWPKYSDVMAAMSRCTLCATDSGSMQEEMNMMGIPCATLRYGSDRPETFQARSNVLCPPVSADVMTQILLGALANLDQFKYPKLYGEKVSEKLVDRVVSFLNDGGDLMRLKP